MALAVPSRTRSSAEAERERHITLMTDAPSAQQALVTRIAELREELNSAHVELLGRREADNDQVAALTSMLAARDRERGELLEELRRAQQNRDEVTSMLMAITRSESWRLGHFLTVPGRGLKSLRARLRRQR
jgi:uncharacterized coiled-coil DUF342 family protein